MSTYQAPHKLITGEQSGQTVACPYCASEFSQEEAIVYCPECGFLIGQSQYRDTEQYNAWIQAFVQEYTYEQNAAGVLSLQIHNNTGDKINTLEVNIECEYFEPIAKKETKHNISKDAAVPVNINIKPVESGILSVKLYVICWNSQDEVNVFEASNFIIKVQKDKHKPQSIYINASRDISSEAYGVDNTGDIHVNINSEEHSSAESAGKSFKSGEWRKLSMRWCPESTRLYWQSYTALYTQADKKPQKKMDTGVHAAWLILRYSNGDICSRLYLHFRTDLNIGRDTGVDVTCMPEDYTGQNQQTGFVSRKHLSLQILGDACVLKDHSTNGTWIDRSCINKQEAELRNNQVINLGGVYCFKYEEFRDLSRLKGRLRDLQLSRQSTGTPHHTVTGIKQEMKDLPISAVCLRRLGGNSNNCQYFMVLKELDIGSNKANALVLKDDSVAGQHAKLLFQGNRVQLLDLGSSSATRLNDQDLEPYRAVDIGQRDKIQFGRIVGHIHFVRRAN